MVKIVFYDRQDVGNFDFLTASVSPVMRALFLSLAILLVHVSPLRAARNPAGQPLTAMARALRTGDNILAGTWDTMDERDEAQDAAWDDELVRIVGLHPAGLLALELRTSSLNTTAVQRCPFSQTQSC